MPGRDGRPAAVLLMGATATGKTGLAVELVQRLPLEIVSVDSAMVYRGLDIGTAKPGPELLRRAPHRLIDIIDPAQTYSAARFREDALREMRAIVAAGRIPLLVGGTMLYFRALSAGLSALPPASPAVRARLAQEAASLGWDALHRRLATVDPAAARRIHPHDPQRIQRALEVYELTGRALSTLQGRGRASPGPYRLIRVALVPPPRDRLRDAIRQRFEAMMERGLVREVEELRRRADLGPELPSMRSVGYRQVWEHLEGRSDLATMRERAIAATAQLAKRQMTWLRKEAGLRWLDPRAGGPDSLAELLCAEGLGGGGRE